MLNEREVWSLDQIINERGVRGDRNSPLDWTRRTTEWPPPLKSPNNWA